MTFVATLLCCCIVLSPLLRSFHLFPILGSEGQALPVLQEPGLEPDSAGLSAIPALWGSPRRGFRCGGIFFFGSSFAVGLNRPLQDDCSAALKFQPDSGAYSFHP